MRTCGQLLDLTLYGLHVGDTWNSHSRTTEGGQGQEVCLWSRDRTATTWEDRTEQFICRKKRMRTRCDNCGYISGQALSWALPHETARREDIFRQIVISSERESTHNLLRDGNIVCRKNSTVGLARDPGKVCPMRKRAFFLVTYPTGVMCTVALLVNAFM
jgi:hypothetical protein